MTKNPDFCRDLFFLTTVFRQCFFQEYDAKGNQRKATYLKRKNFGHFLFWVPNTYLRTGRHENKEK
jgi:hypothetical protein